MEKEINFSRFTRAAEPAKEGPAPQLRPRAEIERNPAYFQRTQERERSDSSFAGSSMGGGVWAGRLAHRER
jgi:hypothetical protein